MSRIFQLKIPVAMAVVNILMAHFILPAFNRGDDFLLFSTWRMFSGKPSEVSYDITWDKGETFLFRDGKKHGLLSQSESIRYFRIISTQNIARLKNDLSPIIRDYCKCIDVIFVKLQGSLYEHYILKNKLLVGETIPL